MKLAYKMFIVLTLISLLSGGLLSAWNSVTEPRIKAYRLNQIKLAIKDVIPAYDFYEEIAKDQYTLYIGRSKANDAPTGVAVRLMGNGFQGRLSIMVGMKTDFTEITGIKVLEQAETPGLGSKVIFDPSNKEDPSWFTNQFQSLKTQPEITVIKNVAPTEPYEIQAISGATITSKAVADIINGQIGVVKSIYSQNMN